MATVVAGALIVVGLPVVGVPFAVAQAAEVTLDPTVPVAASLTGLTAGGSHACGLTLDGVAYCWGSDTSRQLGNGTVVTGNQLSPSAVIGLPAGEVFTQLTAGYDHTCGLTGSGTAYCWGAGASGQLGDGVAVAGATSPVLVSAPAGVSFTQLAAGETHTCGVTSAGTAFCWGSDLYGRLGNGGTTTADQLTPSAVAMPAETTFTQLTASREHTCGVTSTGAAYCWGSDTDGRLGNGDSLGSATSPSPVDTLPLDGATFTQLSAGHDYTCGLTSVGTAFCWGWGEYGQRGSGWMMSDAEPSPEAVTMPAGETFTQLDAGYDNTCALTAAGAAFCWGDDYTTDEIPEAVSPTTVFTGVNAGWGFQCAVTGAGAPLCWGSGTSGELGNGVAAGQPLPTPVDVTALPPGTRLTDVTAGNEHTCGLAGNGAAYCWGLNGFDQLGIGSEPVAQSPAPVLMPAGVTFTQVTAGERHTCGLATTGAAYCWGDNTEGQLGDGSTASSESPSAAVFGAGEYGKFTQLAAGRDFTCGLTEIGDANCWGADAAGQLGNGADSTPSTLPIPVSVSGGTTFTQLTAGYGHACGLTGAGTVLCWGNDGSGQRGDGASITDSQTSPTQVALPGTTFTALDAGSQHTCAVTGAGAALCWGFDGFGQRGDGAGTTGAQVAPSAVDLAGTTFTEVTAGLASSCGVTGAGAAFCWGADSRGQLGNGAAGNAESPSEVDVSMMPGTTFTHLATAGQVACGVTTAQVAFCWGNDDYSQLGNGPVVTDDQVSPSAVDLEVSVSVADQAGTVGAPVTLTAVTDGVGPASIKWFRDGVPVLGETARTYTFTVVAGDADVVFSALLTNAFNRTASDPAVLTAPVPSPAPAPAPVASPSPSASPSSSPSPSPAPVLEGADRVVRVSGTDRLGTALAVSARSFGSVGDVPSAGQAVALAVVLARSDLFADALAGTPLAAGQTAPLLLTGTASLDGRVAAELQRVLAPGGQVFLLGGEAALAPSVESQVRALGFVATRFSGANRYETAVAIARDGLGSPASVLVATGLDFPDAVVAGAAAAQIGGAVLLTSGEVVPAVTAAYLASLAAPQVWAVGGPASRAVPAASPLVGANRVRTALLVAEEFFASPVLAGVATGLSFPDSVTGGAQLGRLGGPMLLTDPTTLSPEVADYLTAHTGSLEQVLLLGGEQALAAVAEDGARSALA